MLAQPLRVRILAVLALVLTTITVEAAIGAPAQQRAPANDNFANAQPLPEACSTYTYTDSNRGATKEAREEGYKYDGSVPKASVWYTWIAPSSGDVTFHTSGSSFDTVLAVYTWPNSSGGWIEQDSNDDDRSSNAQTSRVIFPAVQGTKYYIVVDGYNGKTGTIKLSWTSICNPAPASAPQPAGEVGKKSNVEDKDIVSSIFSSSGHPLTGGTPPSLEAGMLTEANAVYMPAQLNIPIVGFEPGTVSVQLIRPDGMVRPSQPDQVRIGFGNDRWNYIIPLIDPPGVYTIRATQGNVVATVRFSLVKATSPTIIIDPLEGPRGAVFTVYLAGYLPNSNVTLNEFRYGKCPPKNNECWIYLRSFLVRTDAQGQTTSLLRLNEPEGLYRLYAVASGDERWAPIQLGVGGRLYQNPKISNFRLDWCYAPDDLCGWTAAYEWCKTLGYANALSFQPDIDVGRRSIQTKILSTGGVCKESYCDAFKNIACIAYASRPQQQTFFAPIIDGYRLDVCYNFADQCGPPAANAWCRTQGFATAIDFEEDPDLGEYGVHTKIINTGEICDTTACGSFKSITCIK